MRGKVINPIREGFGARPKLAYTLPNGESKPQPFEALTPRQAEILRMVAEGLPYTAIAERLGISERTVRAHMNDVLTRLGVYNRHEAVVTACRMGLITLRLEPETAQAALRLAHHYIALAEKLMQKGDTP